MPPRKNKDTTPVVVDVAVTPAPTPTLPVTSLEPQPEIVAMPTEITPADPEPAMYVQKVEDLVDDDEDDDDEMLGFDGEDEEEDEEEEGGEGEEEFGFGDFDPMAQLSQLFVTEDGMPVVDILRGTRDALEKIQESFKKHNKILFKIATLLEQAHGDN